MAMAKGVNANLARRWVVEAERRGTGALVKAASGTVASTFVPLQLPSMQAPPLDIRIELRCGTTTISVSWPCAAARKHQQVAFLHPRPPQRSLPICHQPFTIPLPPIGRGHFQMEDQPAPSIVPDQDGGQQFGIVQGNVARAGVAGQEMRYGRLRVGPA